MIPPNAKMPSGTVEWSRTVHGLRVVLAGEIDLSCCELLDDAAGAIACAMPDDVVVDVTRVTFLSSHGLGFLAASSQLVADQHGRSFTLHNPRPTVERTAKLFGILDRATVTRS
jgi:anti-anti-sigma factor